LWELKNWFTNVDYFDRREGRIVGLHALADAKKYQEVKF
jgi:hypothetical protein